jgi:prepilin-type N-terminal cleavage/methylation domain-containing protein
MAECRKRESGMTFVEVIVAMTIVSILILTLTSLLHVGFSFWDYIDHSRWTYSDIQLVVDQMGKDFRTIYFRSADPERFPFKGDMYQVNFRVRDFKTGQVGEMRYEYVPTEQILYFIKGESRVPLLEKLELCNWYYFHPEFGYWDNYWDAKDKKLAPSAARLEFTFVGEEGSYRYDFPIYIEQKGIRIR